MKDLYTINDLDVEKQREYVTMLDKAMELSRRAMREPKIGDASHAAAELVVSLKRSLKTGYQHFVEWAKTLKPTFDEHDCAFATRGSGAPLSAVAFTKEGYGCSLSFSVQDVLPESATMQIDFLSNDGSRLRPFELTVMDADTNQFFLKRKTFTTGDAVLNGMTVGNYIFAAVHGEDVVTLKHRIDGSINPQRVVENPWPLIDAETFRAKFDGDDANVEAFLKVMLCYLEEKTNSKEWTFADRDVVWEIFLKKIFVAFSDMARDIKNINAYGKTVLASVIHTVWVKIKNRPITISGDKRNKEDGKTLFEKMDENQMTDGEALRCPTTLAYVDDEPEAGNKERVAKLLSTLSPKERKVVILRVMCGIPSVMVAECLGIEVNNVDVTKLRALEKMRKKACAM